MATIESLFLRVVRIDTMSNGQVLTNATGFFFLQDGYLFVITCRHVVIDEAKDHRPDAITITMHSDANDPTQTQQLTIPLYADGQPRWRQPQAAGNAVDMVAVAVDDPLVLANHHVDTFSPADVIDENAALPVGQEVLIIGYPLGFHDTVNYLPIVRHATIASSFQHPFKGDPYFLTDARTHRGTSGSPVVLNLQDGNAQANGAGSEWRLLGVHSATLDVPGRDPQQDERLGLNIAWYATLIKQLELGQISPGSAVS